MTRQTYQITLHYHAGYHDGPLSGACEANGERLWFDCAFEESSLGLRVFAAYRLTDAEWVDEDKWHALFVEHVGVHTDYQDSRRPLGGVKAGTEHHKFYDAARKAEEQGTRIKKQLSESSRVGYFDLVENCLRAEPIRDHWSHGEHPPLLVHKHDKQGNECEVEDWEDVQYRVDAQVFGSEGNVVTTEGWAIRRVSGETAPWALIRHCPWCGVLFPLTPPASL